MRPTPRLDLTTRCRFAQNRTQQARQATNLPTENLSKQMLNPSSSAIIIPLSDHNPQFAPPVDLQSAPHIDGDEATRFLRLIDATALTFTFQTFAEKGNNSPNTIPRVIHS